MVARREPRASVLLVSAVPVSEPQLPSAIPTKAEWVQGCRLSLATSHWCAVTDPNPNPVRRSWTRNAPAFYDDVRAYRPRQPRLPNRCPHVLHKFASHGRSCAGH
jgi:hypothetical protein